MSDAAPPGHAVRTVAEMVFVDDQLGLKGGTAINLFLRDMPRLFVELDLAFTDYTVGRKEALARIGAAIRDAPHRLRARGVDVYVPETSAGGETKLMVRRANLSPIARDTLLADVTPGIRRAFVAYLASHNRSVHVAGRSRRGRASGPNNSIYSTPRALIGYTTRLTDDGPRRTRFLQIFASGRTTFQM